MPALKVSQQIFALPKRGYIPVLFFAFLLHTVPAHADNLKDGIAAFENSSFSTALNLLQPLAIKGNPKAQEILGEMCDGGLGVKRDEEAAEKWYQQALKIIRPLAAKGDSRAQVLLGEMYYRGLGVPGKKFEVTKAFKWFRKSADQGNAQAQSYLGTIYYSPPGPYRNEVLAAKWFLKAAHNGDANAQYMIASMYAFGKGVKQDSSKAYYWYRQAAGNGCLTAQRELAVNYALGSGVKQDSSEARKWYNMMHISAEHGNADAQGQIGWIFTDGDTSFLQQLGVKQDYSEALKWYQRAADQGNLAAQASIGSLYEHGEGVTQDWQEAYFHYILAGKIFGMNYLENAKYHLTKDQQAFVEKRAEAWQAKLPSTHPEVPSP